MSKKDIKILISIVVFVGIEIINALTIAGIAFDMIYEGCHEVPQDMKKIRDFLKRIIMLTTLKAKQIRDKVTGNYHPVAECPDSNIKLEMEAK